MNTLRNQVQLIGNLGNNPDIFQFKNGNKKATLSLATNETYINSEKEKITKTQWHQVIFFGKSVEIVDKYLKKGKEIAVNGKLTYREYTDKEGNKRFITEIVGNELVMLGNK
jgi:single-strand DNA-binding protein